MQDRLAIFMPTRNRPHNLEAVYEAWDSLCNKDNPAQLIVGVDEDQVDMYPQREGVIYDINPNMKLNPKLNTMANKYAHEYRWIGFQGDDHVPRTPDWDQRLVSELVKIGEPGVVYPNDLYQQEKIPTSVVMSSKIVQVLGYFSAPDLVHMCIDLYWKELGYALGRLKYVPNVVVEHMHWSNGKSPVDDLYKETNFGPDLINGDYKTFWAYLRDEFPSEIRKVKAARD